MALSGTIGYIMPRSFQICHLGPQANIYTCNKRHKKQDTLFNLVSVQIIWTRQSSSEVYFQPITQQVTDN